MTYVIPLVVFAAAIIVISLVWRATSRRRSLPCPVWLAWMLDNPISKGRTLDLLSRLELSPGLQVLDGGCGPGRLTIPIAHAVGAGGAVLAVDIQPTMLQRAEAKTAQAALSNVQFLLAGLGEGRLPRSAFDRAILVTVLGEIPDRLAALRDIYSALKPGGFLLVSEIMGDPHYQSQRTVSGLAQQAGFRPGPMQGNWLAFTIKLERPGGV